MWMRPKSCSRPADDISMRGNNVQLWELPSSVTDGDHCNFVITRFRHYLI